MGRVWGRGTYFFHLRIGNHPPPFHCVRSAYCMERWYGWPCSPGMRLLYAVHAVHNGMTKGRISSPTHAYAPFTALISNPSSGVRVSTAVDLRVVFRAVCRVFSVLCGSLLREGIYLPVERRKRVPACAGTLCSYCMQWVTLLGGRCWT